MYAQHSSALQLALAPRQLWCASGLKVTEKYNRINLFCGSELAVCKFNLRLNLRFGLSFKAGKNWAPGWHRAFVGVLI